MLDIYRNIWYLFGMITNDANKLKTAEYQRYGRNKSTQINKSYIDSGEYRKKFDCISDNPRLNKQLCELAKKILKHRSGTLYEDMYWLNPVTGAIVAAEDHWPIEREVGYSKSTRKIVKANPGLVTVHSHPNSLPPSVNDFNSCFIHKYSLSVICCHNGKVFVYNSNEIIDSKLYEAYVNKNKSAGLTEFESQWAALEAIKRNADIHFMEVQNED